MDELTERQKEVIRKYYERYSAWKPAGIGSQGSKGKDQQPPKPKEEPKPEAPAPADLSVQGSAGSPAKAAPAPGGTEDQAGAGAKAYAGYFPTDLGEVKQEGPGPGEIKGERMAKSQIVITCDGEVQVDYEKNQACFFKNVRVASDDGTIDSDKITVYLDPNTKRIREIVAEGNVKIVRGASVTYSQAASYSATGKKVRLSGESRLVLPLDGGIDLNADFIS